ncbi:hypothetical protein ACIGO9_30130 [Nocardia asteroides]|uniref:hypothetical protein n=1 Tax=Nocardia asteroides TaxID=1824 RepID=UPI0037C965BA
MSAVQHLATHALFHHLERTGHPFRNNAQRLTIADRLARKQPLAEHAIEVAGAATAAVTDKSIDEATATRIRLLARMFEAGFNTREPALRAENAWHFAMAAEIAVAQEILRIRFGASLEELSPEDRRQWRQTRGENLELLAEAVGLRDQRWLPLIEDTQQALKTLKVSARRQPVPPDAVAAALATVRAADLRHSPFRAYLHNVPALALPTHKISEERRRHAKSGPVTMRVWPQLLVALHDCTGFDSDISPSTIAPAIPALAPSPGDALQADLAAGLILAGRGWLAQRVLGTDPANFGSVLTGVIDSELFSAATDPKRHRDAGLDERRTTAVTVIFDAVARSWQATGTDPRQAAQAAVRVRDALERTFAIRSANHDMLDDLGTVFAADPARADTALRSANTVDTAARTPNPLTPLDAALSAAPSSTAPTAGETPTVATDVGAAGGMQGVAM